MSRLIAVISIAGAGIMAGSANAVTVIDMPPPLAQVTDESRTTSEQSNAAKSHEEPGRLALARYADGRRGPRNEIYASMNGWPARSYYGPGYWPFGVGVFFTNFCHFGFVPSIVVSHSSFN